MATTPAPHVRRGPPPSPIALRKLRRARAQLEAGEVVAARNTATEVLALAPGYADALRVLAMAAEATGDYAKALECFQATLLVWPGDAQLHVGLGIALYMQGRLPEGIAELRRACDLAPNSVHAWFNLGEALTRDAQAAGALEAFRRAVQLGPGHVRARLSLARVLASIGRVDEAVREFREVLRRDPANARGWFGLSNLNTVRFDPEDVARIRGALTGTIAGGEAHDLLAFALAKALEDQGDYAAAFDQFVAANRTHRDHVKWDAAGEHRRAEAVLRAFAGWQPPPPLDPELGHEAIFIVSIPRSGSTLVEQILASHSGVEGANEIDDLAAVVDGETRARHEAYPFWVSMATAGDWHRLGSAYLERTARWRQHKPRFTDKNLVTWYVVGAALAMLPGARVVIVRRDPVETCLACFRQWFTGDTGFAYDLDEMADYCSDFLKVARLWREQYPRQVYDFEYESLQRDPDAAIRGLLQFCGLPFEPACLEFHRTERTVLSAPSAAQVREPLRRDTARAARYGDRLDHLRERLRAAGVEFAS